MAAKKKTPINAFFTGLVNIYIFLPYFFSVPTLVRTLFAPWKNLESHKKSPGLSLNDFFTNLSFNMISSGIGFVMRSSILLFFFIIEVLYMILVPFIIVVFFILYPFILMKNSILPSEEERKEQQKQKFIKTHLVNQEYTNGVAQWFEYLYETRFKPTPWWELKNLFSIPPLARDWAHGYTPKLNEYTEELTKTEYQLKIRNHIIGREKESNQIQRVLSQSEEANAILVGESGVGKHTIINLFAKKIYEGKTNSILAYKRLLKLNMEKILNKHTDMVKREQFFEELIREAAESKNVILLLDNMERYVSQGENHIDMSASIAKFAQTPNIQFLGITTPFSFEKFIYPNESIRAIFTKIDVEEISSEKAFTILLDQAISFEQRYNVTIPYESIIAVIDKSSYFITSAPFPEKALQLLDWSCIYATQTAKVNTISPEIINTVVTNRTHVPTSVNDQMKQKLLNLEKHLRAKIYGQDLAINAIASTLRRSFLLIGKRKKPIASFLFLGPTGVGKTETAKVIAGIFFDSKDTMIRFDMSLYQSKDDISKLIGSVETLNPGLLTNAIRENPYGVFLVDEIEKAHPDLLNIFLTILDEGYFTDGYGQRVDCKNLIIVATSNAGSQDMHQLLVKQSLDESQATDVLMNYLIEKHLFSPEFLNRFDGVIAYKPLGNESALTLARNLVNSINQEMQELHGVSIQVQDQTLKKLIAKGYNSQFGARNLERVMRQYIEDEIAKVIFEDSTPHDKTIRL